MNHVAIALSLLVLGGAPARAPKAPPESPKWSAAKERLTRAEACLARFEASCQFMRRCLKGTVEDLGSGTCDAIDPGCDAQVGEAPFSRADLQQCVDGLAKLECPKGAGKADPNDGEAMDFETRVPACKRVLKAETPPSP